MHGGRLVVLALCVGIAICVYYIVTRAMDSRCRGEPEAPKFFRECPTDRDGVKWYHIDHRYCDRPRPHPRATLITMLQEFMRLCESRGIAPILEAGGLVGWSFNQKMLPWDDDLDLFVTAADIPKLVELDGYKCDEFFIEVNPNHTKRDGDPNNIIDARVISHHTGLFIDIVFLLPDKRAPSVLATKQKEDRFEATAVLPPQRSHFEGIPVYVPAQPAHCLVSRYGAQVRERTGHGPPGPDRRAWSFVDGEWTKRGA